MSTPAPIAGYVIVGRVRKAHGLRGELVIESLTDTPDAVFAPGRRVFGGTVAGDLPPVPQPLTILEVGQQGRGIRVLFDGINDRAISDLWRGRYLLVPAEELPSLESGEVYLHELDGMAVELVDGSGLGSVVAVYELPQGLALEVAPSKGSSSIIVPYEGVVTHVDREQKRITIDPPDGLID